MKLCVLSMAKAYLIFTSVSEAYICGQFWLQLTNIKWVYCTTSSLPKELLFSWRFSYIAENNLALIASDQETYVLTYSQTQYGSSQMPLDAFCDIGNSWLYRRYLVWINTLKHNTLPLSVLWTEYSEKANSIPHMPWYPAPLVIPKHASLGLDELNCWR